MEISKDVLSIILNYIKDIQAAERHRTNMKLLREEYEMWIVAKEAPYFCRIPTLWNRWRGLLYAGGMKAYPVSEGHYLVFGECYGQEMINGQLCNIYGRCFDFKQ